MELDLFSTYNSVRTVLKQGQPSLVPLTIPLGFIQEWVGVRGASAKVYLDDTKRSLAVQVHVQDGLGWPGERIPAADLVVTAD